MLAEVGNARLDVLIVLRKRVSRPPGRGLESDIALLGPLKFYRRSNILLPMYGVRGSTTTYAKYLI
jgi:hypothetical protein